MKKAVCASARYDIRVAQRLFGSEARVRETHRALRSMRRDGADTLTAHGLTLTRRKR